MGEVSLPLIDCATIVEEVVADRERVTALLNEKIHTNASAYGDFDPVLELAEIRPRAGAQASRRPGGGLPASPRGRTSTHQPAGSAPAVRGEAGAEGA